MFEKKLLNSMAQVLHKHGITECHVTCPKRNLEIKLQFYSNRLQMAVRDSENHQKAPLDKKKETENPAIFIYSQHVGMFHNGKEHVMHDENKLVLGNYIQSGDVLGYVRSGNIYYEIFSQVDGHVEDVFIKNDTPIQYNQIIASIIPKQNNSLEGRSS